MLRRTLTLVLLSACTSPPPSSTDTPAPGVDVGGLEGGTLLDRGLWLEETIVYEEDGSSEVQHHFVLTDETPDCATAQARHDDDPWQRTAVLIEANPDQACDLTRSLYAELAERESAGTVLTVTLWDTTRDEGNIGVLPEDATYTELDGPDADVVEHASHVDRRFSNWWAAVAAAYDCADPDTVWDEVGPQQAAVFSDYEVDGAITFEAGADRFVATLDLTVASAQFVHENGAIEGVAQLERCPVTRTIPISGPVE